MVSVGQSPFAFSQNLRRRSGGAIEPQLAEVDRSHRRIKLDARHRLQASGIFDLRRSLLEDDRSLLQDRQRLDHSRKT